MSGTLLIGLGMILFGLTIFLLTFRAAPTEVSEREMRAIRRIFAAWGIAGDDADVLRAYTARERQQWRAFTRGWAIGGMIAGVLSSLMLVTPSFTPLLFINVGTPLIFSWTVAQIAGGMLGYLWWLHRWRERERGQSVTAALRPRRLSDYRPRWMPIMLSAYGVALAAIGLVRLLSARATPLHLLLWRGSYLTLPVNVLTVECLPLVIGFLLAGNQLAQQSVVDAPYPVNATDPAHIDDLLRARYIGTLQQMTTAVTALLAGGGWLMLTADLAHTSPFGLLFFSGIAATIALLIFGLASARVLVMSPPLRRRLHEVQG